MTRPSDRPIVVFYGNCQVVAMYHALGPELSEMGFDPILIRSWLLPGTVARALTADEVNRTALLVEQYDQAGQNYPQELGGSCPSVRFPSLDANVFWPFAVANPYNNASDQALGGYAHADRILLRCIEQEWDVDSIVDYYVHSYDEFRVDLARVGAFDQRRWEKRDAACDIAMSDVLATWRKEPLFLGNDHPGYPLLETELQRIIRRAASELPALRPLRRRRKQSEIFPDGIPWGSIPIHPGVAAELDLPWYKRDALYLQTDGRRISHDDYVREFVVRTIAARGQKRIGNGEFGYDPCGFLPPVEGELLTGVRANGIYDDGFAAPQASFEIEARSQIDAVAITGYYPAQHSESAVVSVAAGPTASTANVSPGTEFRLLLGSRLKSGERLMVALTCSKTLNMFERGLSEDTRDLGVLILGVSAATIDRNS